MPFDSTPRITPGLRSMPVPGMRWLQEALYAVALDESLPKTAQLALESGIPEETVRKVCYQNALDAYGQSGQMNESDWLDPPAIDQRTLYEGNSILRGGREPKIETPGERRATSLLIE